MHPPIIVGMPVFNGAQYLAGTLDSVLAQTFPHFQLIISDNASSDDTQEICRDFARRDARIKYFRQPVNIGGPKNFNYVFQMAGGKYFKWAAVGDLCDIDLLRICKTVLDEQANVVLCFGKTVAIDQYGQITRRFAEDLILHDVRPSRRFIHLIDHIDCNNVHAGLFRADALRKTKPEQTYPGADLVRIAELTLYGIFHEVPQVLFYRREAPGTATSLCSPQEIMEFRSPGTRKPFRWPKWRFSLGHFEAVLRSPIPIPEKATICKYLIKDFYWHRHRYWREICDNL